MRYLGVLAIATFVFAGCDPAPQQTSQQLATLQAALDPGDGVRVKGPNRCMTDADCEVFACDCTCTAISPDWQKTQCVPSCFDDLAPCDGLESVCEGHDCVLATASPSTFACGPQKECLYGEACTEVVPGMCGGTPGNPDGTCPEGCSICGFFPGVPGGVPIPDCTCSSFSCGPPDDGCTDCKCLTGNPFVPFQCEEGPGGELYITIFAP